MSDQRQAHGIDIRYSVVFEDGEWRAYASKDGHPLWGGHEQIIGEPRESAFAAMHALFSREAHKAMLANWAERQDKEGN